MGEEEAAVAGFGGSGFEVAIAVVNIAAAWDSAWALQQTYFERLTLSFQW